MPTLTASRRHLLICLALVLATVAVYWPVWFGRFLSVDDHDYVSTNLIVQQGLSRTGFAWAFGAPHVANYHPVTWLSHMLDCQLFGVDPRWHHAVNLAFHCLNVVLLYLVLRSMTGRNRCSALVAAVFAIHPLHVESVAWIAERKDVLSAMFFLLTLAAWTSYVRRSGAWRYLGAVLLCALGLLSKAMLVTMPGVLLLLDVWPLGRTRWWAAESLATDQDPPTRSVRFLLLEKLPFALLAIACSAVTMIAQSDYGAMASPEQAPFSFRFGNAVVGYVRYLRNFIWPAHLSAFYPLLRPWPLASVFAAVIVLAVITAVALLQSKQRPYLGVGWFWFLGTLVPVIGLVQVGNQSMADRYMYIPLIGLAIAAVWAGAELLRKAQITSSELVRKSQIATSKFQTIWDLRFLRHASVALVGITLLSFAALTAQEVRWWHDSQVLFTRAIEQTEPNVFTLHAIACALLEQGKTREAIARFEQCAQLQPSNMYVREALGEALSKDNRDREAMWQLASAMRMNGNYARTWAALGHIFIRRGNWVAAVDHFEIAVQLDPDNFDSRVSLATAHRQTGQTNLAQKDLEAAVRLAPGHAQPWYLYGVLLLETDQPAPALTALRRSTALDPKFADGQFRLGLALMRTGRGEAALGPLMTAVQLAPDAPEPLAKVAWVLATYPDAKLRRGTDALALAERANSLSKSSPQFLAVLAAAYAEQKQYAQAAKTASDAAEMADATGDGALRTRMQAAASQYRAGEATRDATLVGADAGELVP